MLGALKNPQPTGFKNIEELMVHKDLTDALKNYYKGQDSQEWYANSYGNKVFYPSDPVYSTNVENRTQQDLSFLDPTNSLFSRKDPDAKVSPELANLASNYWARATLANSKPSTDPMAIEAGINNINYKPSVPLPKPRPAIPTS